MGVPADPELTTRLHHASAGRARLSALLQRRSGLEAQAVCKSTSGRADERGAIAARSPRMNDLHPKT